MKSMANATFFKASVAAFLVASAFAPRVLLGWPFARSVQ